MQVSLRWVTPNAEQEIAYMARGSSPANQENPEYTKLFRYCLRNGHWSPLQMASMCVFVETSLAVGNQIKRHWSLAIHEPLDLQEFSQRYADPFAQGLGMQPIQLRAKAATNRQSSSDVLTGKEAEKAARLLADWQAETEYTHRALVALGVANETARMILPQATTTRFFISGSCRSWIHYLQQRDDQHAQLEHQEVAKEIKKIFAECFPVVSEVLETLKEAA